MAWIVGNQTLENADQVLRCYVATEDDAAEMAILRDIRDQLLSDIDSVQTPAEVNGLIYWLLRDHQINCEGASLDETAERLGDLDIEADEDRYTDLIFTLKMAIERLDDLMLDAM